MLDRRTRLGGERKSIAAAHSPVAGSSQEPNRSGWWLAGALVLVAVAALAVASRSSLFAAEASIGARNADPNVSSHCVNDIVWRRDGGPLVQDARRLVANGQLVETEAKLREATRRDPEKKERCTWISFSGSAPYWNRCSLTSS